MGSAMATRRAHEVWRERGLRPIGLHECRHTYASLMIAAGVNAKALSTYMGHSSITVTLDRYGHLMPGNEREAGAMLDAYLAVEGGADGSGGRLALAAWGGIEERWLGRNDKRVDRRGECGARTARTVAPTRKQR